jgi:hypothetical protein
MPGGRDEETAIHDRFSHLRLGRTEQFRPASDLMEFIGRPLLVDLNPDAVEVMSGKSKPMALQMRGAVEWKAWLEKLAEFDRTSVADVADRAIARYAKEIGFPDPPPKR